MPLSFVEYLGSHNSMEVFFPVFFPSELRQACRVESIRKGEQLFHLGDNVQAIYRVVAGEIRLVRYGTDGGEILLHRASAGEYFAEASLGAEYYHCTAVCTEEGALLTIPVKVFRAFLKDDNNFAFAWAMELAGNLRTLRRRFERLSLKGAPGRVLHYLQTESAEGTGVVHLPGSLKAWATDMNLAHETLYRTLNEMEARGLIERQGQMLRLLGNA